jgi:nicotinamide-nucleotide amidase
VTGLIRPGEGPVDLAALVEDLAAEGATVATAESITGGRTIAALTSVPGSSAVVRGGVVAYASDVKVSLLGVDAVVLVEQGAVCAQVAEQMASGVRERLGATYGLATTGEAGPDSASGRPVGTVFVAVTGPQGTTTRRLELRGTREEVQRATVQAVLGVLGDVRAESSARLRGDRPAEPPGSGNNRG